MTKGWIAHFSVRLLLIAVMAATFHGCGDDEPEPPEFTEAPPAAPAAAPPASADVSPTAQLFGYAPADPAIVAVLPSLRGFEAQAVGLSKRLTGSEDDVNAALAEWSAALAMQLGVEPGDAPSDVIAGLGVDPDAPIALYIDMDAFSERLMAEVQRLKAEADAEAEDTAEQPADTEMPDAAMEPEAGAEEGVDIDFEIDEPSDMDEEGMSFDVMTPAASPFATAGLPSMVAALTVADVDKAVAKLDEALQQSPQASSFAKEEREIAGATITVYDPHYCSYFVRDGVLFVGNELAWLEAVAGSVQSPGTVPETTFDGTVDDEQLIASIRLDRMEPFFEAMNEANTLMPGQAGMMAAAQVGSWDEMKDLYSGTDPAVATLRWDDSRISLDTRLNLDEHPAMKAMAGSAGTMRLATVLPESTQAMFGMRFTPEMKEAIRKYWIDALPPEAMQDPNMIGVVMGANQALDLIDDEIVLGVTGIANGMPTGLAMVGLNNPEAVIQQFGMFIMMAGASMPEMPSEPGAVQELTFGGAMTVYYTILNNALMVASVREELESAVENLKTSSPSGYFASLDPAMEPGRERYFALSLKPEAVSAFAAMQGGGATDESMDQALKTIEEVRFVQEMEGPWLVQDFDVYLTAP